MVLNSTIANNTATGSGGGVSLRGFDEWFAGALSQHTEGKRVLRADMLSRDGRIRDSVLFAMPETGIGLFPDVGGSFLHGAELDDFERLTGLLGFGFHTGGAQDQDGAVNGQGRPRRWNPMLGQPNMLTAQQRLKAARELVVVHLPGLILLKLVI